MFCLNLYLVCEEFYSCCAVGAFPGCVTRCFTLTSRFLSTRPAKVAIYATMSPFSLFLSSFSGAQRILGYVRPRAALWRNCPSIVPQLLNWDTAAACSCSSCMRLKPQSVQLTLPWRREAERQSGSVQSCFIMQNLQKHAEKLIFFLQMRVFTVQNVFNSNTQCKLACYIPSMLCECVLLCGSGTFQVSSEWMWTHEPNIHLRLSDEPLHDCDLPQFVITDFQNWIESTLLRNVPVSVFLLRDDYWRLTADCLFAHRAHSALRS